MRHRNRLWVVALALICCSCTARPEQGVLVPAAVSYENASRVTVLVATTRQRSNHDPGDMFGSERASALSYASVTVSVPPPDARGVGEIQWPASLPGNPRRDFVTLQADFLDKQAFNTSIATVATTGRSKVLVFVHGFNNRFDESVYRLVQIVDDSGAPVIPVLFSWPSRGIVGVSTYRQDRDSASQSVEPLNQVLDMLAHNPNVTDITVLCHSMGCFPTLGALQSRSLRTGKIGAKIRNILLVAPDVDFNAFQEQMQHMGSLRPRFALFLSQDDRALRIAQSISGGAPRLGNVNPDEEPFNGFFEHEGIFVFDMTHLQGNAHSRAFSDITSVMGMIERRFAAGQQMAETVPETNDAAQ